MNSRSEVRWSPKAVKQLFKLEARAQRQIVDATTALESMPNCTNVRSLKNHQYGYQLRVGDYRVLFDWTTVIKL